MRKQPDSKKARRLLAAVVVLLVTVSASVGAYAISAAPDGADDVQTEVQTPVTVPEATDSAATPVPSFDEWLPVVSPEQTDAPQGAETADTELPELPSREFDYAPVEFPLAWPIETEGQTITVSALYGGRTHPVTGNVTMHSGIDIVLPQDTPVLAAAAGTVTESGFDATLGNYVVLEHLDGLSTLYAHMTGDVLPEVDDPVEAGEQIGAVGATGAATGYHLHFEVRVDESRVDPLNYLPCVINAAGFGVPET